MSLNTPPLGVAPNIAWSAATTDSLTIWVGHYADSPSPRMEQAWPLVRWEENLQDRDYRVVNMQVSPDHRSLAVLVVEMCIPPTPEPTPTPGGEPWHPRVMEWCMGEWPKHLSVIDLQTGKAQSVPDYYRQHQVYQEHYGGAFINKILGWFDNDRFGLEEKSGQMVTATKDGGSFIERRWPNQRPHQTIYDMSLLPDHRTIFASLADGFFFRNAATGEVHKVGNRFQGGGYGFVTPSPDGARIAYLKAGIGDARHFSLWVQELATDRRDMLIGEGVWDTQPSWSSDSSQIAFAFTEAVPNDGDAWIGLPEKAETNIYIASVIDHKARRLTRFANAHNSGIQWTPDGNLVLSSTAGSQTGSPGIVAVSTRDGKAKVLVSASPGEQLVHPLLFK